MDYYTNAIETEKAALVLFEAGLYRQSVYMSCLAVELFLKSKIHLVEYREGLELSHDIINLYRALKIRFAPKTEMDNMITKCKKYFNESRYPYSYDVDIYNCEFAYSFVRIAQAVKQYVEEECVAGIKDLKRIYPKDKFK